MSDTAETLLREHLKLCSEAYEHGLVPTKESYWVVGDGEYVLCKRWYFDSDLHKRTLVLLSALTPSQHDTTQTTGMGETQTSSEGT